MNDYYVMDLMEKAFRTFVKKGPYCNSCQFRKSGLTTICKQYKRIPSRIQQGGHCEKYAEETKKRC